MSYQFKAACPRDPRPGQPLINIPSEEIPGISQHRVFRATAIVTQTWLVDSEGDWVQTAKDYEQTFSTPSETENSHPWSCETCGTIARVKEIEE
jgi:hypothetical protein